MAQLAAEALSAGRVLGAAWSCFQQAAESALLDLGWVDHCPVLGPLRELRSEPFA
jgi:hypothetical protein